LAPQKRDYCPDIGWYYCCHLYYCGADELDLDALLLADIAGLYYMAYSHIL